MPTKKNKGVVPPCPDERLRYVTAACGKCYECKKQKGRAWQVRLSEEIRNDPNAIFVTLTISDESWEKLKRKYSLSSEDDYIKKMVRLFLERIRKQTKKSVKHWLTTERGENNTERYHRRPCDRPCKAYMAVPRNSVQRPGARAIPWK